jgi:hypothetical protein
MIVRLRAATQQVLFGGQAAVCCTCSGHQLATQSRISSHIAKEYRQWWVCTLKPGGMYALQVTYRTMDCMLPPVVCHAPFSPVLVEQHLAVCPNKECSHT